MTRATTLLLLIVFALAGCSATDERSDEGPVESPEQPDRIEAADGSFTIEIPDDWTSEDRYVQDSVVVAAQGEDDVDQLLVSVFDEADGAEDQAIFTAAGLAGEDIACERLDDDATFGESRLVFDCAQDAGGSTVRRLLFPIEHEGESILVLVQTTGDSREAAAPVVAPILESLTWQ